LVDDLITIISYFSGKMYGLRSHRHVEVVGVIRTYSLKHEKREEIEGLLRAYNETLNAVIVDIWESTRWRKVKIKGF
jgi:hypothetical protein